MDRRWFILLAVGAFLALGFGQPQLAAFIGILFIISGAAFLIDRLDRRRLGKRMVTIKAPKTTPPK